MKSIDIMAFFNCKSLSTIIFQEGLINISQEAFRECSSLKEIIIPQSVKCIGDGAFRDCENLTKIVLPNNLEVISDELFNKCSSLEEIKMPEELKEIGNKVFVGCKSLKSIFIPKKVDEIALKAFEGVKKREFIVEPDNKFYYSENGKLYSRDESQIDISKSKSETRLTSYKCNKILKASCKSTLKTLDLVEEDVSIFETKKIAIEEGIEVIPSGAFRGFDKLSSLTLPKTLKEIHTDAINDNMSLKELHIPDSVTVIEDYALGFYTYVSDMDEGGKVIPGFKIYGYENSVAHVYAYENGMKFVSLGESTNTNYDIGKLSEFAQAERKEN